MKHETFVITRHLKCSIERAYAGWADPDLKEKWFHGPTGQWRAVERRMEFVVDGCEYLKGEFDDNETSTFDSRYLEIVPLERIVYAYRMYVNHDLISVSLATVAFQKESTGTKMTFTEQAVYYGDRFGGKDRLEGSEWLLNNFEEEIDTEK
ncbi:MAG TPA: SRPBCC domain-containing protein [Fimbriimonas sp.]|nr:SRPBCC domain-containing protein [Fimbriimonas sp.]